jgi:amino acid adenylation domain-containing protein
VVAGGAAEETSSAAWPRTVVDLVLDRAAATPDAPAVSAPDGRLTYAELVAASAAVAARLPRHGRVALWVDRGRLLPVCVLGAMRAGAVFAILDPAQPDPRTLGCLEVLRPELVVHAAPARPLPPLVAAAAPVLEVAAPRFDVGGFAGEHPEPGDDAYVLFTSGTTGVPKAVLTHHAPLAHFLEWQARAFAIGPADRVSVLSGLAHDPLLRDLFAPLAAGGVTCVHAPVGIYDPDELRRWLRDQAITIIHLTPALAHLICEREVEPLPAVRLIFSGGARLHRADVEGLRALAPGATVVNVYGTSETPQVMAFHSIAPGAAIDDDVPLGRGIDGVEVMVAGDDGAPAAPGTVGEIVVRTGFLSRGYLDDADLTRARYRDGYHTGDLGLIDDAGRLRFRGRRDRQLDLNGFRIEPGEIEAALVGHPAVTQAVVVAADRDGEPALIAYVVGPEPDAERELREFVAGRLPSYMVPSRVVAMTALPLTPNRKVDVAALPAPPPLPEPTRRPTAALGRAVVDAWRRVLGRTPDLDDDFFAIGGSSLLALRMLGLLEEATGVRLPMRALLGASTPAALAERLAAPGDLPDETVLLLRPGGRDLPLFLLPGGGGISVVGLRDFTLTLDIDRPVYGLEVPIQGVTEQVTIDERAADFVRAIRTVQPHGPYHLLGFSLGSWIAFEMTRQLEAAGEDVALLVVFDTHCAPRQLRSRTDDLMIRYERYRHLVGQFMRRPTRDKVRYLSVVARSKATDVQEWSAQRMWEARDRLAGKPRGETLAVDDIDKGARLLLRHHAETFAPPPIRAPITIILADVTSFAGVDPRRDPRLGWRHFTTGGIDVRNVPGSHLGMMMPPNLEVTAGVISACVARLRR